MDEIGLVIKMPKEEYETIVNSEDCGLHTLTRAVAHGTILPKGHGRLIDADKAIKLECGLSCGCNVEECGFSVPCKYVRLIQETPTIIEADGGDAE